MSEHVNQLRFPVTLTEKQYVELRDEAMKAGELRERARAAKALATPAPSGGEAREVIHQALVNLIEQCHFGPVETLASALGLNVQVGYALHYSPAIADALLALRTPSAAGAGEAERIEAGMLELWREDADKIERWMGGAKSTYDRRTLDLVKAVRALTAEVARLYAHPPAHPVVTEAAITKYTIGDIDNRDTMHRLIHVEYAGKGKWAVRRLGDTLNHEGEWEYEPMPSSRDDEYLARNRYNSAQEAITAALTATRGSDADT